LSIIEKQDFEIIKKTSQLILRGLFLLLNLLDNYFNSAFCESILECVERIISKYFIL